MDIPTKFLLSPNIVDWISKGYLAYVDKEKALNYLYFSERNISEATDNPKLSSVAKIVKDFENPSVEEENVEEDDVLFREGEDSVDARDIYEHRVSRAMFQTQEALQDSMLGLKEAMDAIIKGEAPILNPRYYSLTKVWDSIVDCAFLSYSS